MRLRTLRLLAAVAVGFLLVIAGLSACGSPPKGGATFILDGRTVSVSGGGYASVTGYRGSTGCGTRHFVADYDDSTTMVFGFTSTTATLNIEGDIYKFAGPPTKEKDKVALVWSQDFGEGGAKRVITVKVGCSLPS